LLPLPAQILQPHRQPDRARLPSRWPMLRESSRLGLGWRSRRLPCLRPWLPWCSPFSGGEAAGPCRLH